MLSVYSNLYRKNPFIFSIWIQSSLNLQYGTYQMFKYILYFLTQPDWLLFFVNIYYCIYNYIKHIFPLLMVHFVWYNRSPFDFAKSVRNVLQSYATSNYINKRSRYLFVHIPILIWRAYIFLKKKNEFALKSKQNYFINLMHSRAVRCILVE